MNWTPKLDHLGVVIEKAVVQGPNVRAVSGLLVSILTKVTV
jgi:hypothetical protein